VDPTLTIIGEFLRQGILGLVIAGLLLGWLHPKWVVDEYRKREAVKDAVIERQSIVIEKLAQRSARAAAKDADA